MIKKQTLLQFGSMAGLLGMATALPAQLATIIESAPSGSNFFGIPREIADVTGDGIPDFVVGAPGSQSNLGQAYLYSGANLSLVRTLTPTSPAAANAFFGGNAAQAPNLGGSSFPDVFIAATGETFSSVSGAGVIYIYDVDGNAVLGKVGSPNPVVNGGFGIVAGIQDLNSDSIPDLVVGASGEGPSNGGRFYVLSGADYSTLSTINSPNPISGGLFGVTTVVPDLNGDSVQDIVISATGETVASNSNAGRVYVYSGADRTLLYAPLVSPNAGFFGQFGISVTALPDSNSDGRPELIIGSGEQFGTGRSYVFSGASGALLQTINPPNPVGNSLFGPATVLSDITGDSVPDFAIGSVYSRNAALYSGADRSLLFTFTGPLTAQGSFPNTLNDVDGDGRRELVLGDYNLNRLYVYGSAPAATLTPSSANFGIRDPAAATPGRLTLTLRNTGLSPLILQAPFASISGADPTQFAVGTFPGVTTLIPNATTTVGLEFSPTSEGVKQAILSIPSNSPASPTTASLTGTGVAGFGGSASGLAYVGGGITIYAVDLSTGNRTVLSGPNKGTGPTFNGINGLEILDDDFLLVADGGGTFLRVDRVSGDREILGVTLPSFWVAPRGLVRENANSMIVGISSTGCARLDLNTGIITTVSNVHGTGSGPNFFTPFDVAMESNGTIIVGDVSGSRLFRVNPANGARTILTDGTCPPVYNVDRDASGNFIVLSGSDNVYRTNAASGVSTILSSNSVGTGITMTNPRAVAVSSTGNLFVYDPYIRAIIRVDQSNGNRTVISSLAQGFGIGDDLITTTFGDFTMHMVVSENPPQAAVRDWALYE